MIFRWSQIYQGMLRKYIIQKIKILLWHHIYNSVLHSFCSYGIKF